MASIVVFLVALPLCMGIAIASGVPPALGLVTGIVGGIVVGAMAGQPLQVSGPAAGLAVMVWQLVEQFGLAALGLAVLIAGVVQLVAGIAGLGRWFRAVAPAVILGMLAGIGVLIFASQFHVMVDDVPRSSGLANLFSIPSAIYKGIFPIDGSVHHIATVVGIITIGSIVLWNKFRPTKLRMLPGALVGVTVATVIATVMDLPIARVSPPSDLLAAMNWITPESFDLLGNTAFWGVALGMAVIASAETLLCAAAVDRIHDGERTNYDKELRAQGVGNILCGVAGALPMTGVIVRSSANVEAGGKTRVSAILHGVWILVLVVLLPQVLALIPTASLAAVLVFTGWKLIGIQALKNLAKNGRSEVVIWTATVVTIVATDLLIGVATGFALALGRLLLTFARLEVKVTHDGTRWDVTLIGAATFISLPKLGEALEKIPDHAEVHFHLDRVDYMDHACIELIESWHERHPGTIHLETDRLRDHAKGLRMAA
ncbi:MAG: SulP family inorganic anion transporter [Deltaproteobacteria bacterium]|nr:MAG: SulP family inorganic anion transporter [Deltaproteobacteria bacterium]